MLSVFFSPKKKKVILIKIPKKPVKKISNQLLLSIFCRCLKTMGINSKEANRKRIKAKAKGGIYPKANLNIGDAPP